MAGPPDSPRLVLLRSRALQGMLFFVSVLGFAAAAYAQASWLQNVGAAIGVGFCIPGCAGLWLSRAQGRAQRGGRRGQAKVTH